MKLGADGYGVWAITFALVEYYWFFDFGFRSATVKFVAHYSAIGDRENVRAVLSTVLLYSSIAGVAILAAVLGWRAMSSTSSAFPKTCAEASKPC